MSIPAQTHRPRRVLARTLALGSSALLAAGLLAWSPGSTTGWNQGSAEGTLWQLLNGARVNNGIAPLQQHGTLVSIARWRSSDMLNRNYFSHTIPGCNCLVYTYYDQNGLNYAWAGENISWNSGQADSYSPVHAHNKFMGSAGHRKNVLDPAFTHGGVGAAAANDQLYQGYVQDTRMYTELFMQAGGSAPAPPPEQPALPPPSGGGGGGGGGGQAPAPAAPQPTPEPEPTALEVSVGTPQRPVSKAGIDGVATVVLPSVPPDLSARLVADDLLGVAEDDAPAQEKRPGTIVADRGMEVTAAAPSDAGLFEGIVGSLLGFLLG
ncbi:MAG: CAP domain-containing protein [Thermoleophilaceae bacterium]